MGTSVRARPTLANSYFGQLQKSAKCQVLLWPGLINVNMIIVTIIIYTKNIIYDYNYYYAYNWWEPEGWEKNAGPKGGSPKGGGPQGGGPKFRAFFSLSRHNVHSFFPLFGAAGDSHDSPRTPNVHISGSRPSKTPPKFNEKTPREGRRNENCGGGRKKKSEILFGPAEGGPAESGPDHNHNNHNHNNEIITIIITTPKIVTLIIIMKLAKVELAKVELAKVELAKVELATVDLAKEGHPRQ